MRPETAQIDSFSGTLITPGHPEYERARHVWNGMIDKRPALVAQCMHQNDMIAALKYARDHDLTVSIRGGGHNVAGHAIAEAGMVVDLSCMRAVRVDPQTRIARVEPGATLADVDRECAKFGLAVPVGLVSATGIAGLSLGGGYGWLSRRCGLTADNLVRAEVIPADTIPVRADANTNTDLFWALRGGGGGFAVVSAFEFQAHPIGPRIWHSRTIYDLDQGSRVLMFLRDFLETAPLQLGIMASIWTVDQPIASLQGRPLKQVINVLGCWSGDFSQGEQALKPLRSIAPCLADCCEPVQWVDFQQLLDPDYPDGRRYYWKSLFLPTLASECIESIVSAGAQRESALSTIDIWMLGGEVCATPRHATAFAQRNEPWLVGIEANWDDPHRDGINIEWVRRTFTQLLPHSSGRAYINFAGSIEDKPEMLRRAYGANLARLENIRKSWDPAGRFSPR